MSAAVPAGAASALVRSLAAIVGEPFAHDGAAAMRFSRDATESRGLRGRPDAAVLPADAAEVAAVLRWCYDHDVPVVPRGGGTGYAGGAVPVTGGVVIAMERLAHVAEVSPEHWRMQVGAGLTTAHVQRLAAEQGLYFAPDPGAAEQSQIGGNVATNAGGPHTFKYGVTGTWVTGLEAVVAPGEIVRIGGTVRKDVAAYDMRSLLVGSEGTLGLITAVSLRLLPAPEVRLPVAAAYPDAATGCAAIDAVRATGSVPAALEYLDAGALRLAGASFPVPLPDRAGFLVVAEADGSASEAARARGEFAEALSDGALVVHAPEGADVAALWRWRAGVSFAVIAQRGGKASEDIAVPLDRLAEAIDAVVVIGRRHGLEACSWGHAGDGNLHATFLVGGEAELAAAEAAADELFDLAIRLGGTVSGEHGIGWVKRGALGRQLDPRVAELHAQIKRAFDPKNLLNPGKKVCAAPSAGTPLPPPGTS